MGVGMGRFGGFGGLGRGMGTYAVCIDLERRDTPGDSTQEATSVAFKLRAFRYLNLKSGALRDTVFASIFDSYRHL